MKHLEYINESAAAVIKLEKYFEDNLRYLLDIGYKINVFENTDHYKITIGRRFSISAGFSSIRKDGRKWSDIMYDVIPFIIQLDNNFYLNKFYNESILEIFFNGKHSNYKNYYSINDIENLDKKLSDLEDADIFNLKLLVSKKSPSLRYLRKIKN
jgi:hypothetical protein